MSVKGTQSDRRFPYGPVVSRASDVPEQIGEYPWGRLHYLFTPFDVAYMAETKDGVRIDAAVLEYPLESERARKETIAIIARRIEAKISQR